MGKKNIDELFQEKFLDFNEVPDERVWNSIEASLNGKKKKRVVPLWWKIGGIAAVLILGFFLINPFGQEITSPTDSTITDTNKKEEQLQQTEQDTSKEVLLDKNTTKETQIATENTEDQNQDTILKKKNDNFVTTENKASKKDSSNGTKENKLIPDNTLKEDFNQKEGVAQHAESQKRDSVQNDKKKTLDFKNSLPLNEAVVVSNANAKKNEKNSEPNINPTNNSNNVVDLKENPANNTIETAVAENTASEEKKEEETVIAVTDDSKKKSIYDEIEKEQEDEETIAENTGNRWSAGPSIAPVYYNAIGEGSPVHSIFVPNEKSGNVNLSYGLSVAYELTSKLTVRSGIHKVDYGYDTNDVAFSSSVVASTNGQIDNIDYRTTARNLVVTSKTGGAPSADVEAFNALDASAPDPTIDGVMSQQLGYLEVPVELNYALIDKKFGVNIIGGVSSLFLVNNTIALTSGNLTTEIGEANNVNDVNFSTNVGLGLNYKFSPKLQLNVEPIFKYQLNAFSEADGTFRPYSIGIYSGLSFKF
ncbi:hypothetical protein [Maribacter sp. 2210JD10-5]|uniref:hypothetical protein n=1 Tax=Maribacter sp. 2210JD10-5 TaxID=3386272 RepID=UPI0039BCFDC8